MTKNRNRKGLPPPDPTSMSIFERGDGRFVFVRDDREIGWLEGRTIAFSGFGDMSAARRAATVAYDALCVWLARQGRSDTPPRRERSLGVRVENGEELLTLSGVPIGKLHTSRNDDMPDRCGFELLLPQRVGAPLVAAQIIDQALTRHRTFHDLDFASLPEGGDAYV